MADREKRLNEELQRCRENISRTKELIAYHRETLKKQEKKEADILAKLDEVKMNSLCSLIHQSGYDIDSLRQAVTSGNFEAIASKPAAELETQIQTTIPKTAESNSAADTERKI